MGVKQWEDGEIQSEGAADASAYRHPIDREGSEPVTTAIADAVSAVDGRPPAELDPLYPDLDTDALNRLFTAGAAGPDTELRVEFTYAGYTVRLDGDAVLVTPEK